MADEFISGFRPFDRIEIKLNYRLFKRKGVTCREYAWMHSDGSFESPIFETLGEANNWAIQQWGNRLSDGTIIDSFICLPKPPPQTH